MGHYSDFFPDAIEGDQMHVNAFELFTSDHEVDEVEDESGSTTQYAEGEERDEETSKDEHGWKNEDSDSDDSLVISL